MRGDLMTEIKEFGNYLKKLRKENGLTIRQLTEKSGVSNAYLSQLETGKRGIPKPEILAKLHGPLNVGYDELMEKAGYISSKVRSELHPQTLQAISRANRDNSLNELISNAADIFISSITDDNGVLKDEFKNYLIGGVKEIDPTMSKEDINKLLSNSSIVNELFENLTFDEKIEFLNIIIKDFIERDIDPKDLFKSNAQILMETFEPISTTIRVPVLGFIAAGQPILAEDNVDEWTEIPNMWNLKQGEVIVLKVKGDSMIGSRIFEGDKVVVKIQPEVENGEIAVVNVNGDEATLKRVKKTDNGQVILYPDNPKYEPIFINNEGARIIGKVIQVMFEPNKLS
jgi:SOS regulatory protein LexA